ncbi:DJ-1/PfpI family protein [Peribacillus butanolivorans]|uniref:DJ-1/PfpI family protein n=1 Tax=Peribacillus butanolivorans TaxID=421767 RepID=UPI0035D65863
MKTWKIGILLFDDVDVLDFAGPFEVFAVTMINRGESNSHSPFDISTISETGNAIIASNGLKITPDYSFTTAPYFDLLIIPGGKGTRKEVGNKVMLDWIYSKYKEVKWLTSVCTGAFLLAEKGLLDGKKATTHWASIERMRNEYPLINVVDNSKFVDEDKIVTSAGISAGIHMSFHMVRKLLGKTVAKDTARFMEYDIEFKD